MKIRKAYQGTIPENSILDTYSESQTDAYSCNYVNNKLSWTLIGTSNADAEIDIPESFNEILVVPYVANNTNLKYPILIPYVEVSSSYTGFDSGYYGTGGGNSGFVRISVKTGKGKVDSAVSNGVDVKSTTKTNWYYR